MLPDAASHLHLGHLPKQCIASFAVGLPVLVDFSSNAAKPVPTLVMGKSPFSIIVCKRNAHPLQYMGLMHIMLCDVALHLLLAMAVFPARHKKLLPVSCDTDCK